MIGDDLALAVLNEAPPFPVPDQALLGQGELVGQPPDGLFEALKS
jgi:hypothetical protein